MALQSARSIPMREQSTSETQFTPAGDKFAAARRMKMLTAEQNCRGVIDANGNVLVPCSKDFLVSLSLAVLRSRSFPLTRLLDTPRKEEEVKAWRKREKELCQLQIQRIQMITTEIRRLLQFPGLFPSRALRIKFAALVASDANLQFVQAVSSLLIRKVQNEVDMEFHKENSQTYMPGSKGWENFYLNMAPGIYDDEQVARLKTAPETSLQLIPAVGMRVMGDRIREEQLLMQWIRDAELPVSTTPAMTTKLLDLDDPGEEEQLQEQTAVSQKCTDGSLGPNPFKLGFRPHWDIPVQVHEPLEELTSFVARLDAIPRLPQPVQMHSEHVFRALRLRTWHPPTKIHELRYQIPRSESQGQ